MFLIKASYLEELIVSYLLDVPTIQILAIKVSRHLVLQVEKIQGHVMKMSSLSKLTGPSMSDNIEIWVTGKEKTADQGQGRKLMAAKIYQNLLGQLENQQDHKGLVLYKREKNGCS